MVTVPMRGNRKDEINDVDRCLPGQDTSTGLYATSRRTRKRHRLPVTYLTDLGLARRCKAQDQWWRGRYPRRAFRYGGRVAQELEVAVVEVEHFCCQTPNGGTGRVEPQSQRPSTLHKPHDVRGLPGRTAVGGHCAWHGETRTRSPPAETKQAAAHSRKQPRLCEQ